MSAWKVQAARISMFPLVGSGLAPKSALDLYKAVWGKEPDSYQSHPSAGGFPFPMSVAQGVAGTITRTCQTQPIRADFTFQPIATNNPSVLPSIEETELLVAEIRGAANLREVTKAEVVHAVETGEVAHANMRIEIDTGGDEEAVEQVKTLIVDRLWRHSAGPEKYVCLCDEKVDPHPSDWMQDGPNGRYVDPRTKKETAIEINRIE